MNKEEWKEIPGFPSYFVSNLGKIRGKTGLLLSKSDDGYGYQRVGLRRKGFRKTTYAKVHRLVALAFIANPENKKTVEHIDSDRKNNNVNNLKWATHFENNMARIKTGRGTKLNIRVARIIRNRAIQEKLDINSLAKALRVSSTTIRMILNGKMYNEQLYQEEN